MIKILSAIVLLYMEIWSLALTHYARLRQHCARLRHNIIYEKQVCAHVI